MKFPPLPGAPNGDSHPNNFPYFRLAEMYLIKAEAMNELGQTAQGVAQANIVRSRHFATPNPIVAADQATARAAIQKERLFEFAGEAKRRQDLIRAGTFTAARRICTSSSATCTKEAVSGNRILFPIPATQIQSNPLLTQNPGY
jgi:hypothetical protein